MSTTHAEFVVLSGPQKGQKLKIAGDAVVIGRAGDCNIPLKEDYVSRRQVELVKTVQGWLMENVSANGTLVNGKRYKSGAKIILDTGDVLGVGMETELLFVDVGDDADEALDAYRQKAKPAKPESPGPDNATGPDTAPIELPAPDESTPQDVAQPPLPNAATTQAKPPTARLPVAAVADDAEPRGDTPNVQSEDVDAAAKKAKFKKYGVLLAIYFVAMLGLITYILIVRSGDNSSDEKAAGPKILNAKDIEDALRERPKLSVDLTKAAEEQRKAEGYYGTYGPTRPEDKYLCIKHYKLYMAYSGSPNMPSADEQKFIDCLEGTADSKNRGKPDGLITAIQQDYSNGVSRMAAHQWVEAEGFFSRIMTLVPEQDPRDPTYQGLMMNVNAWHEQAKSKIPRKR